MSADSIHLRRLAARVARTGDRLVAHAAREQLQVADLRNTALPWFQVRTFDTGIDGAPETATLFIFDEIGGSFGVNAKHLIAEIENITAPTIHVRINSPGGAVFDAIAIHNALRHHQAKVVCYVDALAASAATVIAMAGDEVVMMPGSQMMIHDASAVFDGNSADMLKMATWLDRQSDNIADLYRAKAGGDAAEWRGLMTAETWLFAAEAVTAGLADRTEVPAEPIEDPEMADLMSRAHSLDAFRYAGRRNAPAPAIRTGPLHTTRTLPRSEPMPETEPPVRSHTRQAGRAFGYVDRANSRDGGPLRVILATEGRKADGIDLRMAGADLDRFRNNPVLGYGHHYDGRDSLPIGRVIPNSLRADNGSLVGDLEFDQADEFARTVQRKMLDGYLSAVSIGFAVSEWDGDGDYRYGGVAKRWELTELSVVPIPMDADAIVTAGRALSDLDLVALARDLSDADFVKTVARIRMFQAALRGEDPLVESEPETAPESSEPEPATEPIEADHPPDEPVTEPERGVDSAAARALLAALNI